jgi:predicted dehydrogenase
MNTMTRHTVPANASTSRRDFLKQAVAASAAFSAPGLLTRAWAAEAAVSRVNVGLIGCGGIAEYHVNHLCPMADVRIVAVADAYKSRRESMATRLNAYYGEAGTTTAHADFREILARADVDAVVIAAHDHWHVPMAIAAARAGKDIYCQKPLALDFSLTGLLRQAVNEKKRIFQFGTQYRSNGRYRKMIELVRNGYIGKLERIDTWCRDVSFNVGSYHVKPYGSTVEIPAPEDLDFDAWMGPSPMVPYTADRATCWGGYHCPETSLGFIAGCGIHELGLCQWGNKSDHTSPIRYQGTGTFPSEGIFRTLAQWDVTCEYANGVKMRLMDLRTAAKVVGPRFQGWHPNDGTIFYGTEGWIGSAEGFCASDGKLWKTEFKQGEERLPVASEHNRNFIDCVKSRQETLCPVEMAIRCDTICHLAVAAAQTGRTLQWDPAKEEVVGDAEAAKLLTRVHRDRWKVW